MKTSEHLTPGCVYARSDLKRQFAITDATINNGIFLPKDHESVWIFITKDKPPDRTQYEDTLEGNILRMEGQLQGRTDHLIIDHEAKGREIVVFYRVNKTQHPNSGFTFEGTYRYVSHNGQSPAQFVLHRNEPR